MFKVVWKIKQCRIALTRWSKANKYNAEKEIKNIKQKLKELNEEENQHRRQEREELRLKLKESYRKEELCWSQKARVSWLKGR